MRLDIFRANATNLIWGNFENYSQVNMDIGGIPIPENRMRAAIDYKSSPVNFDR